MSSDQSLDPNWWRQSCVYQIYPRSFADGNGDGIGDFKGVTSRVEYLEELGIDAAWFSPFYPSDLKDGGYDVADYRNVDKRIGTLEDFDEMVKALRRADIKTIVDIVPNHCSDQHAWFQEALKAPKGSRERERFIFRDGLGEKKDQPPNDWESYFGGSAWEQVGDGQFYLHLYDTSQPDFNWDCEEVKEDFIQTLEFWADRGVAGFRIDVALGCAKDMSEPYLPQSKLDEMRVAMRAIGYPPDKHPLRDRDAVLEIYKDWRRRVFSKRDPPLMSVAEAWVAPDRRRLYAAPDTLGQSFAIETLGCAYSAPAWKHTIDVLLEEVAITGSTPCWAVSNHDFVRHATRYGLPGIETLRVETTAELSEFPNDYLHSNGKNPACDLKLGQRRAKAVSLMLMALPGSLYIYQGEELGLPEVVEIPADRREDPKFFRTNGENVGRDGCRVPIPWESTSKNFGFGNGKDTWLPQPDWFGDYAAGKEDADPNSFLNFYRLGLKLRREMREIAREKLDWQSADQSKLHFSRGNIHVIANFGTKPIALPKGEVLIRSDTPADSLGPNATAWVKL